MGVKRAHLGIVQLDDASRGQAKERTPAFFWKPVALALGAFILVDKVGPLLKDSAWVASETFEEFPESSPRLLGGGGNPAPHGGGHEANTQGGDHGGGHGGGHGGSHPHEALFYLVLSIVIGTFIMHLSTIPVFKGMQTTVVLFVLGVLLSVVMSGMEVQDKLGAVGRSYKMWMSIDSHLLLFTLLPPLLAGDAMTIDISVALKVSKQCLYLAGPGVCCNSFLVALFLYYYLPYHWDFLLCLSAGAILSATDPVAVVALLKELGASPMLTVQIQGESLLNDGTSIVLFNVAYDMLMGKQYEPGDIVAYLVKMAIYAWMLGIITGMAYFLWIKAAKRKLNDTSSTIQVLLTIACAYTSFIVAEGIFHISGVLCTVAASLFMAAKLWPEVVYHETMHTIWHMLENIGNTVIFFLAGSLTGRIMSRIRFVDYLHLLAIYGVLVALRFTIIILSRPLLQCLSVDRRPVPLADACVMAWGGLRGAVGLALGIKVSVERAGGRISEDNADRLLFYVGGVAFLTLVINALSCPALVKWLEITKTSATKQRLLLMFHQQLVDEVIGPEAEAESPLMRSMTVLLDEIKATITPSGRDILASSLHPDLKVQEGSFGTFASALEKVRKSIVGPPKLRLSNGKDVVDAFRKEKQRFEQAPPDLQKAMKSMLPDNHTFHYVDMMSEMLNHQKPDEQLVRAVNEAFLALVRAAYWHQVEHGEVAVGEFNNLVESISTALSIPCHDINDLKALKRKIEIQEDESLFPRVKPWSGIDLASRKTELKPGESIAGFDEGASPSCLESVCESMGYRLLKVFTVLASSIFIIMEDYFPPTPRSSEDIALLSVEAFFLCLFTLEFALEFAYIRCKYFQDAWCLFDFSLVVLGWVGIILRIHVLSAGMASANVAQTARFLKYFRAVRICRLLKGFERLVRSIKGKSLAAEAAGHIRRFGIFLAFVRAHGHAQHELLRFLGRHSEPDSPELARCLMQSLTDTYKAMGLCAFELMAVEEWMIKERYACQESIEATFKMQALLASACEGGIITSSEAEHLGQSMRKYWSRLEGRIQDVRHGRASEPIFAVEGDEPDEEVEAVAANSSKTKGLVHFAEEAARNSHHNDSGQPPMSPEPAEEPPAAPLPARGATARPTAGRQSAQVATQLSQE